MVHLYARRVIESIFWNKLYSLIFYDAIQSQTFNFMSKILNYSIFVMNKINTDLIEGVKISQFCRVFLPFFVSFFWIGAKFFRSNFHIFLVTF